MLRTVRPPLAIPGAVLQLLGACSSAPGAHENAVPPGVSLQPAAPVQSTGALVLPGSTPALDTTAAGTPPADTATATADTTATQPR
jgi:hypothetical protein